MVRSENLTAAGLMMVSMAAFTINDVFMKQMTGDFPLAQLIFMRGVLTSVAIVFMAWNMGALKVHVLGRIAPRDRLLVGLRTFAEIGATYCFLTALTHLPIANVTAILQAIPLTIAVAAAVFLGEGFGWRRMLAILIGFLGVMLIVRPGAEGFNTYAIYGLVAVAFVTLRDLTTRRLSRDVPSMLVTLGTSLAITAVFGLASLGVDWAPVSGFQAVLICAAAAMLIGGYFFSVTAMRSGEISFVAPFRYTGLIWALILGWLVFGEWPDAVTLLGGAIVVASGVFTLYRETRAARKKPL